MRKKYNSFLGGNQDDCTSKQFVNDVVSAAILATCWHEVPMPPLEGEVPNEREAEGFSCTALLTYKPLRFR